MKININNGTPEILQAPNTAQSSYPTSDSHIKIKYKNYIKMKDNYFEMKSENSTKIPIISEKKGRTDERSEKKVVNPLLVKFMNSKNVESKAIVKEKYKYSRNVRDESKTLSTYTKNKDDNIFETPKKYPNISKKLKRNQQEGERISRSAVKWKPPKPRTSRLQMFPQEEETRKHSNSVANLHGTDTQIVNTQHNTSFEGQAITHNKFRQKAEHEIKLLREEKMLKHLENISLLKRKNNNITPNKQPQSLNISNIDPQFMNSRKLIEEQNTLRNLHNPIHYQVGTRLKSFPFKKTESNRGGSSIKKRGNYFENNSDLLMNMINIHNEHNNRYLSSSQTHSQINQLNAPTNISNNIQINESYIKRDGSPEVKSAFGLHLPKLQQILDEGINGRESGMVVEKSESERYEVITRSINSILNHNRGSRGKSNPRFPSSQTAQHKENSGGERKYSVEGSSHVERLFQAPEGPLASMFLQKLKHHSVSKYSAHNLINPKHKHTNLNYRYFIPRPKGNLSRNLAQRDQGNLILRSLSPIIPRRGELIDMHGFRELPHPIRINAPYFQYATSIQTMPEHIK